jgi:hypothetical protein
MTGAVKERFQRVLRLSKRTFDRSRYLKLALPGGVLLLIGLLVGIADHSPNLAHMQVGVLSASRQGNYHEIVNTLAAEAATEGTHRQHPVGRLGREHLQVSGQSGLM